MAAGEQLCFGALTELLTSLNAVQPSTSQLYFSRGFQDNWPLSPATARKIVFYVV